MTNLMKAKPKIIAIVGQTATGKSAYAVKLALRLSSGQAKKGAEIVSADSRQVYTGLDIGSGKITKREMAGIPHHLLDVALPSRQFSVAEFKTLAEQAIDDILKRGKVPILVGGTGFYIDAIVNGTVHPEVKPNLKLRTTLEKHPAETLFKKLQKLDQARAKTIDRHNKVRLIRAIEIAKALGKVPKIKSKPKYEVEMIGLTLPDQELKERISKRLKARIKQGMIAEAKNLHSKGLSWKRMRELGLEYRFIADYLTGKLSKKEMIEKLEIAINQYAKRQMTWFKRDKKIHWI